MKLSEAKAIIDAASKRGFRISFEHAENGLLRSDYIPSREEAPFESLAAAEDFMKEFAAATVGKCVNFYIVDLKYRPTGGMRIENR